MNCDLDTAIPDWIIEYPQTMVVFNQLKLDISCGGKSLQYVAECAGLNPQDVLQTLKQQIADHPTADHPTES